MELAKVKSAKGLITVDIIIPVFNEQEIIEPLIKRIDSALKEREEYFQILFIDDGSTDHSIERIKAFAAKRKDIHYVRFSRNFGKESAMTAGIEHSTGDGAIIIDADLQDPPELIPEMLNKANEGFDVVYATREGREGESALKRLSAYGFYWLMDHISKHEIPRNTGDFRYLSNRAIEAIQKLPERNRFMKGIFSWIGYPQTCIYYTRNERDSGSSKFSLTQLIDLALDGLTAYSKTPLRAITLLGFGTLMLSIAMILLTVLQLPFGITPDPSRIIVMSVLFMGSANLAALGIIGEYILRLSSESRKRPLYLVDESSLE